MLKVLWFALRTSDLDIPQSLICKPAGSVCGKKRHAYRSVQGAVLSLYDICFLNQNLKTRGVCSKRVAVWCSLYAVHGWILQEFICLSFIPSSAWVNRIENDTIHDVMGFHHLWKLRYILFAEFLLHICCILLSSLRCIVHFPMGSWRRNKKQWRKRGLQLSAPFLP